MTFVVGKLRASDLNDLLNLNSPLPLGVIGYATRETSTGTVTTTETLALRLDDVPIYSGRMYSIESSSLIMDSSVATDAVAIRLRGTTDGSTPTNASTQFGGRLVDMSSSGAQATLPDMRHYVPAADQTLSIALTFVRAAGTGNVQITYATGFPINIIIKDLGISPGDTGVDV